MADSKTKQAPEQEQRPRVESDRRSLSAGVRRSREEDEIARRRERAQLMRLKNKSRRIR